MKIDDELQQDLQERIHARLECEPGIKSDEVKVSVFDGIATVTGSVPCYPDKVAILKALKTEPGIIAWTDGVTVVIPESHRRPDDQLVKAAQEAIDVITTVPSQSIGITAKDGWLTLSGTVDHEQQRNAVEHAVLYLTGLTGIVNLISVKPHATDALAVYQEMPAGFVQCHSGQTANNF